MPRGAHAFVTWRGLSPAPGFSLGVRPSSRGRRSSARWSPPAKAPHTSSAT